MHLILKNRGADIVGATQSKPSSTIDATKVSKNSINYQFCSGRVLLGTEIKFKISDLQHFICQTVKFASAFLQDGELVFARFLSSITCSLFK